MKKIDYKSFGPNQVTLNGPTDKRWWLLPRDQIADSITAIVLFLKEHQGVRDTQNLISMRLYGNISLMGLNGLTYSKMASVQSQLRDRISYNVVQSAIDTVVSKISKNKPKPFFLTQGGDYKLQRKAKKLNKFVEGIFYENRAYEIGTECLRDGCVVGDGIIHVYPHYDRVKFERVIASELLVDEVEGFYGYPRSIHRVKNIDRLVLKELFPEKAKAIEQCDNTLPDSLGGYENISDVVTVRESWHLPSGPDATDGLHVITIDGALLFQEDWTKDYFPFARFTWNKRLVGYWGQGAAEQVQYIQLEINKILWTIQRSMHLAGSFKVLVENGSKIVKEHLNNDIGAIVTYTGTQPTYVTPPVIQEVWLSHLQTLKQMAYEQLGVSQLSAAAQKPAGLDSGEAIRTYNDIETERFMSVGHAYENFYLCLGDLAINCAKDIYEKNGKYDVSVPGKKFIETVPWKDIDLENDEYTMKVFPISGLKGTPSDNLQSVQEFVQAGFISPRTARKLIDFPDLEQVETLADAEENYLNEILEKIVEKGEFTPPEGGFDDLTLAHELVLQYYAEGKCNGLEEEKLQLLRVFKDQVEEEMNKANPPAPTPAVTPQAAPLPTPQSPLLPNVQGVAA